MRQSTRLILNTGATYARMAVTVGMGLVATRLAFQELGKESFDLWALLTMTVLGLVFLAEACYGSAERAMALAIGAKDDLQLRRVFTNGTVMQLAISLGFVLVGLLVGRLILGWAGVAPADLDRATRAYDLIVITISIWIATQTFRSMFVAHQELIWLTLADVTEASLRLGAIVATMYLPGDRVVTYCLMLLLVQVAVSVLIVALCRRCYRGAWLRSEDLDYATARGLFNFGIWAVLGNFSYRVRTSGPPLVLGRAFGSTYNGAYNQAYQLAGYQVSLATALTRAIHPAINAAHGRGDRDTVEQLAHLANKYSFLLAMFYVVPIITEAPTLLVLWLKTPPPMSETFVRLAMVSLSVPWLTMGLHLAVFGHGGIKRYMVLSLTIEFLVVAMAAIAVLGFGLPAWTVLAYSIVGYLWLACLMLHAAWRAQGIRLRSWMLHTIAPVCAVVIPATAAALTVNQLMSPGIPRIVAVGVVYALVAMPLIWGFGMRGYEREHFLRLGRGVGGRISSAVAKRRTPDGTSSTRPPSNPPSGSPSVPPGPTPAAGGPEGGVTGGTVPRSDEPAPLAAGMGPNAR